NFSGADITGADFTDAVLDGTNFTGVRGLESAKGLALALGDSVPSGAEGSPQ
ncbi:MAG: pentapeptide repeat-containing protein, partial [Pseudomonadota bacterium]